MTSALTRTFVAVSAGAAVTIPTILVETAADRAGIGEVNSAGLLVISAVLAAGAAMVAAILFDGAIARGHRRGQVLVATLDGVVATTSAAATSLIALLLLHLRDAEAIGEGPAVQLATWASLHLVSLGLGYVAARAALTWMAQGELVPRSAPGLPVLSLQRSGDVSHVDRSCDREAV